MQEHLVDQEQVALLVSRIDPDVWGKLATGTPTVAKAHLADEVLEA